MTKHTPDTAAPRREDAGDEKPMDYLHPLEMHRARREDAAGERVAQIAARLNAAMPGPWEWRGKRLNGGPANAVGVVSHGAAWDVSKPDAEFIAHSRSDIEYLLAALSTAERERGNVTLSADEEQRVGLESLLRDLDFHARHGEWLPSRTTSDYYAGLIRKALARVPSGGEDGR